MGKRRQKSYTQLTREQQALVEEHSWISGRLASAAENITGKHTGSLTKEDLESIANFGLCVAATRYNPSVGVKYSTYAWKTAGGYIRHALRDISRHVKTPRWVAKYKSKVEVMLKNNKSYQEISEELGIDESKVLICEMSANNYHVSYDSNPEDWYAPEFIYDFDEAKASLLSSELKEALNGLTDAEVEMLSRYVSEEDITPEEKEWASEKFSYLHSVAHGFMDQSRVN